MRKLLSRLSRQPTRISVRLYTVIGLFVVIGLGIQGMGYLHVYVVDSVRAYVAGEGFYSKGRRDAVYHLTRYAYTFDEYEYDLYVTNLQIPIGDRQAREALQSSPPDLQAARAGFLAARNTPADVDLMVPFFLYFGDFAEMKQAIDVWTRADEQVEVLSRLADEIRREVTRTDVDFRSLETLLLRLEEQNDRLTVLENQFSATLAEGARSIGQLTDAISLIGTLAVLCFGVILARQILHGVQRAQLDLEASEARFRHVVESNIIGIVFWRSDGTLYEANDAFLRAIGYARSDLPNLNWRMLSAPGWRRADEAATAEILANGFCEPYEKEFLHKDGHRVPVILGSAMAGENADTGVAFVLDVSSQQELEEQLKQSQKMEAIGTLVGGIAHDFNNTLTAMYGNIALARGLNRDATVEQHLDTMDRLSMHSAKMVEQLMAFARKDIVLKQPVSLNAMLIDFNQLVLSVLPENIAFELDVCDETLTAFADLTQLKQVMLNLLNNARDAVQDRPDPKIKVVLARHGPELVHIAVHDNGVGMSEETRSHLFEPFYTTKEVGKGTGLGMSMVYGSVQRHHGQIEVVSQEGRGTAIHMYLPLMHAQSMLSDTPRAEFTENAGGSRCPILVVDDNAAIRTTWAQFLEKLGYPTSVARDGVEALELWHDADPGNGFGLVITDVIMPRMGGIELVKIIRQESPEMRVIFMTGYDPEQAGLISAFGDEGITVLTKPFTFELLQQEILKLLGDEPAPLHLVPNSSKPAEI